MRVTVLLSGDAERVAVEISHRERNNAPLIDRGGPSITLRSTRDDGKDGRKEGEMGQKEGEMKKI